MEADDRIDLERSDIEALANDLFVDLALLRDVDQAIRDDRGRAPEPAIRGETLLRPVARFDVPERGQAVRG